MQPAPVSHRDAHRAKADRRAPMSRQILTPPVRRTIGVVAALFLGAVAEREAVKLLNPQPTPDALAILRGEDASRDRGVDADDGAMPPADDYALGAMWARAHHPKVPAECPRSVDRLS